MVPIEHVYDQIRAFAADAGARKVVLFGSRAKGVDRPKAISILPWRLSRFQSLGAEPSGQSVVTA